MLLACIKSENAKLHHSIIWFACFLLPIIPAIMGVFNYLANIEVLQEGWNDLWTQVTLFYSMFFFPPLVGLYAAYLWRIEHFNYNWNKLMTMPVPVRDIFFGKLFVICKVSVITQIWMMILLFIAGKYAGIEGVFPAYMIWWALRGLLAAVVIGALQLFLSMIIRNFAIPIGIALFGGILGMISANVSDKAAFFWPYALLFKGMNSNHTQDTLSGMNNLFLLSTIVFFLIFVVISVIILKKRDIKA